MRRPILFCVLMLLLAPVGARAQESPGVARISYLSGASVYVDAGRQAGIAVGDTLRVLHDDVAVALLLVEVVSSRRSSCRLLEGRVDLGVGDAVRFTPRTIAEVPSPSRPTRSLPARGPTPSPRLRGRVGLQYTRLDDRTGNGSDLSRPALTARLNARDLGGGRWDLEIDARGRRSHYTAADGAERDVNRTRVYRLNARWHRASWNVTAGRQYSPALSALNLFDGLSVARAGARWTLGALSGTQPDPEDHAPSTDLHEHGVYAQWHPAPGIRDRWTLTTGLVGSYREGTVNREFLYLQGRLRRGDLSAYGSQEIDLNRSWKGDAGEDAVSPTSSHLRARYRLRPWMSVNAGFDTRRRVRLYRDRETPETAFDDRYRQGIWGGVETELRRRYTAGLALRRRSGASTESANTVTLRLGARRLGPHDGRLSLRATRYTNELVEGWVGALRGSLHPLSPLTVEAEWGLRDESSRASDFFESRSDWFAVDVELLLGRGWFLLLSGERSQGSDEDQDRLLSHLSYRF